MVWRMEVGGKKFYHRTVPTRGAAEGLRVHRCNRRFKYNDIELSKGIYSTVRDENFVIDDVKGAGITQYDLIRLRAAGAIDRSGKWIVNTSRWKWMYRINPLMIMKIHQ